MTNLVPSPSNDLTTTEIARIGRAMDASRSANTRRAYASRWRAWERWCADLGRESIPAQPAEIAAHVTWLADQGRSMSTINSTLAAIRAVHGDRGFDDPTSGLGLTRVRSGLSRTIGTAASKQAHALSPTELRRMLATCDDDGVRGARDRALLLVGFAAALRRSELAALNVADLAQQRRGLAVTLRRSKGDQDGRGVVVGISRGEHTETDPVTAVASWLMLAGISSGPVFVAITKHNSVPRTMRRLSGAAIDGIVQTRAAAAGLGDLAVSGHSLRAGHATTAAEMGADVARIARTTRHARLETLQRYIRPAEVLRDTTASDLGL